MLAGGSWVDSFSRPQPLSWHQHPVRFVEVLHHLPDGGQQTAQTWWLLGFLVSVAVADSYGGLISLLFFLVCCSLQCLKMLWRKSQSSDSIALKHEDICLYILYPSLKWNNGRKSITLLRMATLEWAHNTPVSNAASARMNLFCSVKQLYSLVRADFLWLQYTPDCQIAKLNFVREKMINFCCNKHLATYFKTWTFCSKNQIHPGLVNRMLKSY